MPRGLSAVTSLTLAWALLATSVASADPIGGASYKGPGRGDLDKVTFSVEYNEKKIDIMTVDFDSRCRQGGNNYTNKNTAVVFYTGKIRATGKFKAKDDHRYPGGRDVSIVRGRFSADGTSAKGRFAYEGDLDPVSGAAVHCHAEGRFRATTKAEPEEEGGGGLREGFWKGQTGQGLPIQISTSEDRVGPIEYSIYVECVTDEGAMFSDEHIVYIDRAEAKGSTFEGARGPDQIQGSFDGRTASGVVSVATYYDSFHFANCSGPGEIPFTARLG